MGCDWGCNGDVFEKKRMVVPQLVVCDLCIHLYIVRMMFNEVVYLDAHSWMIVPKIQVPYFSGL